jgi:multidrug efflux pump subunit AcrA (membrane-fusion protein)
MSNDRREQSMMALFINIMQQSFIRCGVMVLLLLTLISPETYSADGSAQPVAPPRQAQPLPVQRKPPEDYQRLLPRKAPTSDIVLVGKAYCSLKRIVDLPFRGTVIAVDVHAGQAVRQGDVLARYRLSPDAFLHLRHKTMPRELKRLEVELSKIHKYMTELSEVRRDIEKSQGQSPSSYRERLASIQEPIQHLLEEEATILGNLEAERQRLQEELEVLGIQLGKTVAPGEIPEEAALIAPITGHVVWMHPEMRPGAELGPVNPVMMVGVMDPMLLRARVYEEETLRLEPGDKATVLPESLPGRRLKAEVSRISWSPVSLEPLEPSYYDVEFNVGNPDLILREGLRVIIRLYKPLPRPAGSPEENPSDNGSRVD